MNEIVENVLDPSSVLNVYFSTLCYRINNDKEFQAFNFCQQLVELPEEQVSGFELLRKAAISDQYMNSQEVILDFFFEFMRNIPFNQLTDCGIIVKIKNYFLNYWNKRIDSEEVNYKISAKLT